MKIYIPSLLILLFFILSFQAGAQNNHVKINPVGFSDVIVNDAFWKPKIDKVATKTLQACIYQTEEKTGRIRNFEKAARNKGEQHEGVFYDDSDVFKALEAMAYAIKTNGDKELEKKADEWIDKIAAAQGSSTTAIAAMNQQVMRAAATTTDYRATFLKLVQKKSREAKANDSFTSKLYLNFSR